MFLMDSGTYHKKSKNFFKKIGIDHFFRKIKFFLENRASIGACMHKYTYIDTFF